ncbi:hypothetical protein Tco_0859786 [Tanacetum coccineum]|uniref:Uncharacterized protein n=1 Tax=Tanacetum coccineum TaxID=301880 RepID=A0ABQ5BIP5_9ASTR
MTPRVYSDLSLKIRKGTHCRNSGNEHLPSSRLPKDITLLINRLPLDAKDIWDNVKMLLKGLELTKENRESQLYDDFELFRQHKGETIHDYYVRMGDKICNSSETYIEADRDSNYDQLTKPQSRRRVVVSECSGTTEYEDRVTMWVQVHLVLLGSSEQVENANLGNVFQGVMGDYDAFDFGSCEASRHKLCSMAFISSADPVYVKRVRHMIRHSYLRDMRTFIECQFYIAMYFCTNDAYTMIYNDMYEPHSQSVSKITRNTVVNNLLTAELTTYKEQVALYERRARFELMEREQKIDEQLRIVITDHNIKEENLKKELHSVKLNLLLPSTITSQW